MTDLLPDPDRPGWRTRVCATCGAGWTGHEDDGTEWCPWCQRANERLRADERRLLLDPPWLRTSDGDARYDALSDVSRAVWDHTRGQRRGTDSVAVWVGRLARAVETGLVDEGEAERAMRRVTR